jgi:hypothetical protein
VHWKISASVDGGRAEGLACADPRARSPIGASGIYISFPAFILGLGNTKCGFFSLSKSVEERYFPQKGRQNEVFYHKAN